MASTHNANHKLHLDMAAHVDDDNDSFSNTTVMMNPNPNPPSVSSSTTPPLFYSLFHPSTDLPPFNHHLGVNVNAGHEESRTEIMEQPLGSSRWNPTPEQLLALEEMYRRGMRTPSSEQIQLIAAQLRRFGKIEGKNVFYWFQNHKARERQKRRRESLETSTTHEERHHHSHHHHHETTDLEKKESGMRKGTIYDVEPTKNWASSSSNWRKHSEEFVSMHTSVVSSNTGSGTHGWPQQELQFQRKFSFNLNPNHRQSFNIVELNQNDQLQETRTLELFPLHSDENEASNRDDDGNMNMNITATINNTGSSFSPRQYIEFLPLKN